MRQTLLKKYAKIRSAVERLHNSRMSPYETMECHEAIRSEIAACWRTDEIRRTKPTPQVDVLEYESQILHSPADLGQDSVQRIFPASG